MRFYDFHDCHRFCEVEAIGRVVEGEDKCVTDKIKIIREIEITAYILAEMAKEHDWRSQVAVANHPKAPVEALRYLAHRGDWYIRELVSLNPNVTADILEYLNKEAKKKKEMSCRS